MLSFKFSDGLNCFIGNNGAGKTNLMDAIYYLSFCKSFLNSVDAQNIRFDQEFFMIQGKYSRLDSEETVYCGLKRNQKKIFKRKSKGIQEAVGAYRLDSFNCCYPIGYQPDLGWE